eukprot:GHVT01105098.1.p1 GENE.GHVT01105098.1~~GHVT01105098.1.p1  ORF type:complete len:157 (-),score=16.67 GHVT01105098.1:698-1168(-)
MEEIKEFFKVFLVNSAGRVFRVPGWLNRHLTLLRELDKQVALKQDRVADLRQQYIRWVNETSCTMGDTAETQMSNGPSRDSRANTGESSCSARGIRGEKHLKAIRNSDELTGTTPSGVKCETVVETSQTTADDDATYSLIPEAPGDVQEHDRPVTN